MLTWSQDGSGYIVHDDTTSRAVARIETVEMVTVTKALVNGKEVELKEPKTEEQEIAPDQWEVHFCAGRFTRQQLKELDASWPTTARPAKKA